jgi:hypothetical protein
MYRRTCALIFLLAIILQGCATARTNRHLKQAVAVLEQRSDADSLAAAAMVLRFAQQKPDANAALALLTRAVTAAPERADLAWLDIQMCREVPGCNPEAEALQLRQLDPSNGVSWMSALVRANVSNDEAARIAVLSALARADRVDIYWTTLIVHLTHALADTKKIPLQEALIEVIGVLAAQAIPAYSGTSNLCKGERLQNDAVVQDCRRVALALERGDTVITEMIGLAIAQHLWAVDSPEWKAAAERRRVIKYRMQMQYQADLHLWIGARWAEQYLSLCAQSRREQDVQLAEIIKAGKSADPPADWAP